ncbi:MAG: NAD(P)/FAD-dependent oxidoreductase [bacterium]|nr:NAD(P)/FAD-dependent oxidoreductase [bacterium]
MKTARAAVVGCGPAGIAAAIQLARHGVEFLLFERERPGGLLWNAHRVENYPGFPGGIAGPDLVKLFLRQLGEGGIFPISEEVMGVERRPGGFRLQTTGGGYEAEHVVLATGTRPKPWDGPPVPPECADRVHTEVYPLRGLAGRKVLIIGAGDAAFDYALSLAESNDVTILNRGPRTRCLPLLERRASREPRISYRAQTSPVRLTFADGHLLVKCTAGGATVDLEADHLLLAVGREPDLGLLTPDLSDGNGRPAAGLHVIGDAAGGRCRQAAIAVGDGVRAAMTIANDLDESR